MSPSIPQGVLERERAERLYRVISARTAPGTVADPAAGAEMRVVVPGGSYWQLFALTFTLVTDATVASRRVSVTLSDGTDRFLRVVEGVDQAASQSIEHVFAQIGGNQNSIVNGVTNTLFFGLPMLLPGSIIETLTVNLQAGDDFGAPVLYVREIPARGEASALSYEVARLVRENLQLDIIEQEGF